MSSSTTGDKKSDWSPDQYILFKQARGRAIDDLIAYLGRSLPTPPSRIVDLGCGPGNSTQSLITHFPSAVVSGIDSSPAMLETARAALPGVEFSLADVSSYSPPPAAAAAEGPTLLFSNAVFHWLPSRARIPTVSRLLRSLSPGSVLALQVPDNFDEPSHRAMRETAYSPRFAKYFEGGGPDEKAELDPIEPAERWHDELVGDCRHLEIWRTEYQHVMGDHGEIVEWVRSTGLMPFLWRIPGEEEKAVFLDEYRKRLEDAEGGGYKTLGDGRKVMLTYPRLFVVAFRG
ncbi:S-adenosyl-L-methionine-dependent methyltransferase [Cladorrhinum samala]|uniref:S-adenosyl-L-methionine-dependent methyltransferase n=1 Tax=Cladorrhinum samala TaxID=585594 RepID=A0AAV9I5U0_9PEZI|nr:S-adenosyl-L-methionine-dependent methyltransferase [Cladorrhinum samala]